MADTRSRNDRHAGTPPRATPPREDPSEAVERIISRRQLLIEDGDIFIRHAQAALKSAIVRTIYELSERGRGLLPGRYTSFEHAVATGDDLARVRHVRLFFQESPDTMPQLLKDYRTR